MIKATGKFAKQQNQILKRIRDMRAEMEDLGDYLDLLEARAVNEGKAVYTTADVKKKLGLLSARK